MLFKMGAEPTGLGLRVVAEKEDEIAGGSRDSPVAGAPRSRVLLTNRLESGDSNLSLQPFSGPVRRAIVDNHDLQIGARLPNLVLDRHDDGLQLVKPI